LLTGVENEDVNSTEASKVIAMDAFATAIAKEIKERGDLVEGRDSEYIVTVTDITPLKAPAGGRRLAGGVGAYVKFYVEPHNESSVVMTIVGDVAGGSDAGLLAKCKSGLRKALDVTIDAVAVDEPELRELAVEVPPTPAPTPSPTQPPPAREEEGMGMWIWILAGVGALIVLINLGYRIYMCQKARKGATGTTGEAAPLAAGAEAAGAEAAEPTDRSMV
jgi:hypothetical protein